METLISLNNILYVMYLSAQDEKRPVQTMHQVNMFKLAYVKEVQAQVLVMAYEGMEVSLEVLLPDEGVYLSKESQESQLHSSL